MDCGNCACFTATMEPKPRHIDCKSNHSLEETNWLLFSELSLLQSFINLWNWLSCPRRGSAFHLITSLSLKRLTSLDVWTNNDIVLSRWELSFPCPIMFSWYFCWNDHHRKGNLQMFINSKHWYNNILTLIRKKFHPDFVDYSFLIDIVFSLILGYFFPRAFISMSCLDKLRTFSHFNSL